MRRSSRLGREPVERFLDVTMWSVPTVAAAPDTTALGTIPLPAMSVASLAERLRRPLVWLIGAVFTLASLSALALGDDPARSRAGRAGLGSSAPVASGGAESPQPPAGSGGDAAPAGETVPPDGGAPSAAAPLGVSVVPAAGVHRYEVQTTAEDGSSTVQEERREIEVLSGDRTGATVRITARLDDERQVSVLDWTPSGALVRSTRIESSAGGSQECTWDPPFPELGALGAGATWRIDSTCQAPVGGVDTRFTIRGGGEVTGQATVGFGGQELRVWQIARDRTTTIEADVGGRSLRQTAREQGTLFFDPARGLVIRSDVTVTLEGPQTGVTRRVSVLQAG